MLHRPAPSCGARAPAAVARRVSRATSAGQGALGIVAAGGRVMSETVPQRLRYGGYWYDQELGWYWVRVRMYDPNLKRWLQLDPSHSDGVHTYGPQAQAGPLAILIQR